jgi:hypothetical protein
MKNRILFEHPELAEFSQAAKTPTSLKTWAGAGPSRRPGPRQVA